MRALACKTAAALAAGLALGWLWSAQTPGLDPDEPQGFGPPLRDRVAEALAGAAAGQASVAAEQPTVEFAALTDDDKSFLGQSGIAFRGPEDMA